MGPTESSGRLSSCSCFKFTQDGEISRSDGVVSSPGSGGPAEVDSAVLDVDIGDNQVSVPQDSGVVHVNGFTVGATPGDDGPGIPSGHTLQHYSLVKRHRDVLWSGYDPGPLAGFRA